MPVAIKGTGGGSVTLTAGAAAADTTLTLPNTTGTVALTASPTFSGTTTVTTLTATTITSPSATALTFQYGGTTGATLDTSGNLLVGTTSAFVSGTGTKVQNLSAYGSRNSGAASGKYWTFGADGSNSFTIFNQTPTGVYVADGGTSWNAFSDERLKTDLMPITDAVSKVSTLRAVTGRLKTDEEGTSRVFLIAQDVQAVLPEAVHVGEDENKTLGLAYTEVIPLLVAAIKELSAKNDALEARLAALEAK